MKKIQQLLLIVSLLAILICQPISVSADNTTDYEETVKLAEQGDAEAQNSLGYMYQNGYGVQQNYSEAVKWYNLAAEQGYAVAQNNLGYMYDKGYGVSQSYSEAVRLYRQAAEQGYAVAQNNLGYMYDKGLGYHKATQRRLDCIAKLQNREMHLRRII